MGYKQSSHVQCRTNQWGNLSSNCMAAHISQDYIHLKILRTWQKISHRPGTDTSYSWQVSCALATFWNFLSKTPFSYPFVYSLLMLETLNTHWKDWCWNWNSSILVIWWEQLPHWKSPWCWERLKAEGEEGIRGWDGWMASPMQWTWAWASFGGWWGTGSPGVLQSMGLRGVGHNWATKQQKQHDAKQFIC